MPGEIEESQAKRATFGMGCFWAGDSLFGSTLGVLRTRVGYAGGTKDSPTYRDMGDHTEVIDIDYDPKVIDYSKLLDIFWKNHEYGLTKKIKRQYMSLVLWHDDEQRNTAEESLKKEQTQHGKPLITELKKFERFYPAEDYHQKYRLQAHSYLIEALRLKTSGDLLNSTIAAKLNGYLAGAATLSQFETELPSLGLTDDVAQYVRRYVIENQGSGLYC